MIYTAHKNVNPLNESRVEGSNIPNEFHSVALKIAQNFENDKAIYNPRKDTGSLAKVFNTLSFRNGPTPVETVRSGRDHSGAYMFTIYFMDYANNRNMDEVAYRVFSKAGLKEGKKTKLVPIRWWYRKIKANDGTPCYIIASIQSPQVAGLALVGTENDANVIISCDYDLPSGFKEASMNISSESATDNGFEYDTPDLTNKDNDGYETKRSLEDYLGYNPDQGLVRSEELTKGEFEDYFRDPKIMDKFTEHMDLTDNATRKSILYMTEAEQGVVLTSLTSKLYDNIVVKVDDIDYGDIPATKGDLTKLPNYEKLNECLGLLHDILREYKQDTGPVDEISTAMGNVVTRKELFGRAFRMNIELPIIMYNNVVLAIIESISLMIATCIEFIKVPNQDSFEIVLDKVAYAKTKSNMIYNTLKKFNKCCEKGDFDKGMEHVIQTKVGKGMRESGVVLASLGIGVVILLSIIPILRELVFLFYHIRMRVSDFFDIQADLIQMNTYSLENRNDIPKEDKERTISKQLKIVELFRKIANKISFTAKKAEVNATKDITDASRKVKIDELDSGVPDSVASSLF